MSTTAFTPLSGTMQNEQQSRQWATLQFESAYAGKAWKRLWERISGGAQCLLNLNAAQSAPGAKSEHDGGMRVVPLSEIVGSQDRACDFAPDFRPRQTHTRSRWIGIAAASLAGKPMPPVELVQVGNAYYVRDGHHRVSVARVTGQLHIDAHVTVLDVQGESK